MRCTRQGECTGLHGPDALRMGPSSCIEGSSVFISAGECGQRTSSSSENLSQPGEFSERGELSMASVATDSSVIVRLRRNQKIKLACFDYNVVPARVNARMLCTRVI